VPPATCLLQKAVADVLSNVLPLSHDQFGNYVVQHLVAKGLDAARQVAHIHIL
jgi:hypothetical protein